MDFISSLVGTLSSLRVGVESAFRTLILLFSSTSLWTSHDLTPFNIPAIYPGEFSCFSMRVTWSWIRSSSAFLLLLPSLTSSAGLVLFCSQKRLSRRIATSAVLRLPRDRLSYHLLTSLSESNISRLVGSVKAGGACYPPSYLRTRILFMAGPEGFEPSTIPRASRLDSSFRLRASALESAALPG